MKNASLVAAVIVACAVVPKAAQAVASAELYRTQAYLYGRFEARIRFATGDGVISSFFLWKEGSEVANAYWNELDFEKLGADCHMQTNAIYGSPSTQHPQTNEMPGDICSEYHDYRFEWTPTYIAWAVDGQEIRRETGATATAFSQNASSGMTFHFNVWPGNAEFGGNFSSAILPVRQYINWVAYSSFSNGSFNLEWREDFSGTSLASGWSKGDWASPYNLSTHNPANVSVNNGIATLSLTADNAVGFSGTPPADETSTGGTNAGGTNAGGTNAGGTGTGGASVGTNSNRGGTSPAGGTSPGRGGRASTSEGRGSTSAGGAATSGGNASTSGAIGTGGNLDSRNDTSSDKREGDSGGSSRGGDTSEAASDSGGSRHSGGTTSKSARTTTSARQATVGGNSSTTAQLSSITVGESVPTASPDNGGCSCRVSSGSANPRPTAAFELFGLAVLLGATMGRRSPSSRRQRLRWRNP